MMKKLLTLMVVLLALLIAVPVSADPTVVEPGYVIEVFVTGLGTPNDLAFDPATSSLFASESSLDRVISIPVLPDGTAGEVAIFAEGISDAEGLALDATGNLYVGDSYYVYKVEDGLVTAYTGGFNDAEGLAIDQQGDLFVADDSPDGGVRISKVEVLPDGSAGDVSDFAIVPGGSAADIDFDVAGDLYVTDNADEVWVIDILEDGSVGGISPFVGGMSSPFSLEFGSDGNLFVGTSSGNIWKVDPNGNANLFASGFGSVEGLVFDALGNLYASDIGSNSIFRIAPEYVQVAIDIKPGAEPNSINTKSRGTIPVALLSGADFDAPAEVDAESLTFGRTGDEDSLARCSPGAEDVNADGLPDLVCHFRTQDAGFQRGDVAGFLKGNMVNGLPIEGFGSIRIVGRQNCLAPPAGLVSRWPGDGHTLDIADDNDGLLIGDATYADGVVGQAFSFDGDGDYVKVLRADNLDMGTELTMEFWMKADPSNMMDDCCQGLVTTDFYATEIAGGAGFVPGVIMFAAADGWVHSSDLGDGGHPLTPGVWYHVAGVYDGASVMLYVNGELVVDPPPQTGDVGPMLETSFLAIGSEDGRTNEPHLIGERYFHGLIDEVGLYNRALSASEILAIYAAGSSGMCKGK
jgi:sugar lactone lactonase YvrE